MSEVTVYHNVSRDASFGLNHVFDRNGRFYERCSHELVKVFVFDSSDLVDNTEVDDPFMCELVFHAFNVGTDPDFERPGTKVHSLATRYRARKLRSLSVGDVVCVNGRYFACASMGFKEYPAEELRVLSARAAGVFVRRRFDMSDEELTVTVPLED